MSVTENDKVEALEKLAAFAKEHHGLLSSLPTLAKVPHDATDITIHLRYCNKYTVTAMTWGDVYSVLSDVYCNEKMPPQDGRCSEDQGPIISPIVSHVWWMTQ